MHLDYYIQKNKAFVSDALQKLILYRNKNSKKQ